MKCGNGFVSFRFDALLQIYSVVQFRNDVNAN